MEILISICMYDNSCKYNVFMNISFSSGLSMQADTWFSCSTTSTSFPRKSNLLYSFWWGNLCFTWDRTKNTYNRLCADLCCYGTSMKNLSLFLHFLVRHFLFLLWKRLIFFPFFNCSWIKIEEHYYNSDNGNHFMSYDRVVSFEVTFSSKFSIASEAPAKTMSYAF